MKFTMIVLLLVVLMQPSHGQSDYTKDVHSPDAIISTLYEVISGDPGQPRDWARFRNLFKPESRLIPSRKNDAGELTIRSITPEEYIELFTTRIAGGFHEKELHRVTEQYGTVLHLFSTYETREKKDGPVTNRGINSIQLFHEGKRYYIISIFWCAENLGYPVPAKYLK